MHEASMGRRERDDTHANGAYIIGMTRFPAPPAGMFETTVLFGQISTVAPSDVPSVFNSGKQVRCGFASPSTSGGIVATRF